MAKGIEVRGIIIKALQGAKFIVEMDNGETFMAYLSGKVRINELKFVVGDKVLAELSEYDLSKGRITRRL